VLSGRGLCDELITRPEDSYRLWCVVVCDLETSKIGAPYIYDISNLRVKTEFRTMCSFICRCSVCCLFYHVLESEFVKEPSKYPLECNYL